MFCLYTSSKLSCPEFDPFNEGEGDGIEFRLPFKIFSTLALIEEKSRKIRMIFDMLIIVEDS